MAGQATFPPVPDVAKVEFLQSIGGPFGRIEFQYELYWADSSATRDFSYLLDLATDAVAAWSVTAGPVDLVNDDVVLEAVRATDLDSVLHLSALVAAGVAGAGGSTAVLPLTVCAVVRIPNTEGGAPRAPYIRFAPINESQVEGNTINSGARAQIDSAVQNMIDALATAQPTGELVVLSVYEPKATGGGTPSTLYRATGVAKAGGPVSTRPLIGRAASRQV